MDDWARRRTGDWEREARHGMERQVVLGHLAPRFQAAEEWQAAVRAQRATAGAGHGELGIVRRLLAGGRAWTERRRVRTIEGAPAGRLTGAGSVGAKR